MWNIPIVSYREEAISNVVDIFNGERIVDEIAPLKKFYNSPDAMKANHARSKNKTTVKKARVKLTGGSSN